MRGVGVVAGTSHLVHRVLRKGSHRAGNGVRGTGLKTSAAQASQSVARDLDEALNAETVTGFSQRTQGVSPEGDDEIIVPLRLFVGSLSRAWLRGAIMICAVLEDLRKKY